MGQTAIPRIDAEALLAGDAAVVAQVRDAAREVGFLTLYNTPIPIGDLQEVFAAYGAFFALPFAQKDAVNMARTGSNRGWGGSRVRTGRPECQPRLQTGV